MQLGPVEIIGADNENILFHRFFPNRKQEDDPSFTTLTEARLPSRLVVCCRPNRRGLIVEKGHMASIVSIFTNLHSLGKT
jgi:hypothetical protein